MKKILLFLIVSAAFFSAAPSYAYGFPDVQAGIFTNEDYTLYYRLYVPDDADEISYPVVLCLHTAGERGNDNTSQLYYGLPILLFSYGYLEKYPAIYIFPQIGADEKWVDVEWDAGIYSTRRIEETKACGSAYRLALDTAEKYNGDISRIYVTGISMGGYGTWDIISRHPYDFAAAVPICGGADPDMADDISNTPVRSYHGDSDDIVPLTGDLAVFEKLTALSAPAELFVIPGGDHFNIWQSAYRDSMDWMFSQRRTVDWQEKSDGAPGTIHIAEQHSKAAAVVAVITGLLLLAACSFVCYKLFYLLALHYFSKRR